MNRRANQSPATGFKISPHHPRAESLAHEAAMPVVIAQLLCARQILTADAANQFFSPAIDHLHDPFAMLGMRAAVERIESAIAQREPVGPCLPRGPGH